MKSRQSSTATGISGSVSLQRHDQDFLGGEQIRLLQKIDEWGSITRAAQSVDISYKTAWDMVNTINNLADRPLVERSTGGKGGGGTRLTPAGKSLIEQYCVLEEEHRKFLINLGKRLGDSDSFYQFVRRISMKVSARNTFSGTVSAITKGAVNAEVTLTLKGGTPLVAVVTNGAIDNLGLKIGAEAYAIIKASSVIIGTNLHDARVSARNVFCGTIVKIIDGPVNTEVDVEIGGGNTISAVITHDSASRLELKTGGHACTLFKASSVIIGVS
jgi:molybdate transport system regulatory protein